MIEFIIRLNLGWRRIANTDFAKINLRLISLKPVHVLLLSA